MDMDMVMNPYRNMETHMLNAHCSITQKHHKYMNTLLHYGFYMFAVIRLERNQLYRCNRFQRKSKMDPHIWAREISIRSKNNFFYAIILFIWILKFFFWAKWKTDILMERTIFSLSFGHEHRFHLNMGSENSLISVRLVTLSNGFIIFHRKTIDFSFSIFHPASNLLLHFMNFSNTIHGCWFENFNACL